MKVMLDSDSCIFLMNRHPKIVPREPLQACCISTVVLGELEYGVLNSERQVENRAKLELFLGNIAITELNEATARSYANLRLGLKKQPFGPNDLWIAAHAVSMDLTLITNNILEFARVPGLSVQTWLKGQ